MEKIKVSIIGSCVTRELFNDPRLSSIFDIKQYGFQVNPINLVSDEGLGIPKEIINKSPNPEFLNRNLDFDLNKSLKNLIEQSESEYIFVDLYSIIGDMYLCTYNGKETIIKTNSTIFTLPKLKDTLTKNMMPDLSFKKIFIEDIKEDTIKTGIKSLAEWISLNFKHAVILHPKFCIKYLNKDKKIINYSNIYMEKINRNQTIIDKWTEFLCENLISKTVLKFPNDLISELISLDYINKAEPNPVHYLTSQKFKLSSKLLKLLGLDYKMFFSHQLEPLDYLIESTKLNYENTKQLKDRLEKELLINIDVYTNWLNSLTHHLIIFCCKDTMALKLKFWKNRFSLGLEFNVNTRDSFIGIIDTKNNFKYENTSQEAITYTYNIPNTDKNIYIESHGWNAKSLSSIIFENQELSKNSRGLNIVVVDLNTFEIVDKSTCDLHDDDFVLIHSDLFQKYNNK